MNESTYTVKGMHCQSCVANVSEAVSEVPGVTAVEVDLSTEKVVVRGEAIDDGAVRSAISAAGYEAA
jgi:copper chaperone